MEVCGFAGFDTQLAMHASASCWLYTVGCVSFLGTGSAHLCKPNALWLYTCCLLLLPARLLLLLLLSPPPLLLLVCVSGAPPPVELVIAVLEQVSATKQLPARHTMRLLPVTHTCFVSLDSVKELAATVAKECFPEGEV